MNAQQYLLREYLRLLWGDSAFQVDWRAVRAGEMDFHDLARKWRLPRTLRRLLLDASREPEELSLQRLQERVPALETVGYAILTPEGTLRLEPELPEKPLHALPEAEPSVETREQYLSRVRLLLQQEQAYPRLLHEVQTLPSEKREVYLRVLQEQEPRLIPEFREKHGQLPEDLEERIVLELAKRYYEACLQAVQGTLTPKRFRNRQENPEFLRFAAECYYLRKVKGWTLGQVAAKLGCLRKRVLQAVQTAEHLLESPD